MYYGSQQTDTFPWGAEKGVGSFYIMVVNILTLSSRKQTEVHALKDERRALEGFNAARTREVKVKSPTRSST